MSAGAVAGRARQHPTGLTAVLASALVIVAGKAGVDLSADEAVILVAAVTGLVSKFTPRDV